MGFKSFLALTVFVLTTEVSGTKITSITLSKGGTQQDYINYEEGNMDYDLKCNVDEMAQVDSIFWYLNSISWPIYTWNAHTKLATVFDPLRQMVEQPDGPDPNGHVIKFKAPGPLGMGLYTCNVNVNGTTNPNPLSMEYILRMFAISSSAYTMDATESNCTILWSFSTPSMYPKPEVTCGFWDPTQKNFIQTVYGGVNFFQNENMTWHVSMTETPLSVDMVPMKSHLKCITKLEVANYSLATEVDASNGVYKIIDDEGCPAIDIQGREHMILQLQECEFNCRDECHPVGLSPVIAVISCEDNYSAYWPNDTFTHGWRLRVTCTKTTWASEGGSPSTNLTLPYCLWRNSTTVISPSLALLILAAAVHLLLTKY